MKNKGFTLVELVAVVAILGLIALFGVPSLINIISDNNSSACKYYEQAMREAAKAYISKEETDILENSTYKNQLRNGRYEIEQSTLIAGGYITSYNDSNTTISNAKVIVKREDLSDASKPKTYTYTTKLTCKKTNGDLLYNH